MKLETRQDYIALFAKRLREDSTLFKQQKSLINSQLKSSKAIFSKFGKGDEFKKNAREYLAGRGII